MKYSYSTQFDEMDFELIHAFLSQSYWSKGMPAPVLKKALENSLCFAIFQEGRQLGFARMITDKATFAYLADVFIVPGSRGQGLSKRLLDYIFAHQDLQGLRRMMLATRDAHGLYEKYGFSVITDTRTFMQNSQPDIYQPDAQTSN